MSYRATIKEKGDLWRAEMLAMPDPVGCEQLACPQCGDTLTVRWARSRGQYQVYHAISVWCMPHGAAWYGATRAEAVEIFRGGVEGHAGHCLSGAIPDRASRRAAARIAGTQAPPPEISPPAGAATIAGWEVSVAGMDEEAVNALLQINSEPHE